MCENPSKSGKIRQNVVKCPKTVVKWPKTVVNGSQTVVQWVPDSVTVGFCSGGSPGPIPRVPTQQRTIPGTHYPGYLYTGHCSTRDTAVTATHSVSQPVLHSDSVTTLPDTVSALSGLKRCQSAAKGGFLRRDSEQKCLKPCLSPGLVSLFGTAKPPILTGDYPSFPVKNSH